MMTDRFMTVVFIVRASVICNYFFIVQNKLIILTKIKAAYAADFLLRSDICLTSEQSFSELFDKAQKLTMARMLEKYESLPSAQ